MTSTSNHIVLVICHVSQRIGIEKSFALLFVLEYFRKCKLSSSFSISSSGVPSWANHRNFDLATSQLIIENVSNLTRSGRFCCINGTPNLAKSMSNNSFFVQVQFCVHFVFGVSVRRKGVSNQMALIFFCFQNICRFRAFPSQRYLTLGCNIF